MSNSYHHPYDASHNPSSAYTTPPAAAQQNEAPGAPSVPPSSRPTTAGRGRLIFGTPDANDMAHHGHSLFGAPEGAMPPMILNTEVRMGQILDEADHKRCSEGNQRALLAEKLETFRRLTKDLEEDDWKFAPNPVMGKGGRGASIGSTGRHAPGPFYG